MTALMLRLAGPTQAWDSHRLQVGARRDLLHTVNVLRSY